MRGCDSFTLYSCNEMNTSAVKVFFFMLRCQKAVAVEVIF